MLVRKMNISELSVLSNWCVFVFLQIFHGAFEDATLFRQCKDVSEKREWLTCTVCKLPRYCPKPARKFLSAWWTELDVTRDIKQERGNDCSSSSPRSYNANDKGTLEIALCSRDEYGYILTHTMLPAVQRHLTSIFVLPRWPVSKPQPSWPDAGQGSRAGQVANGAGSAVTWPFKKTAAPPWVQWSPHGWVTTGGLGAG